MFRDMFAPKTVQPTESPAQMLKRVQAEAEAERVRMVLDDEKRVRTEKIRTERVEALSADAVTAQTESAIKREQIVEGLINYGPLLIITTLAVVGQFGYMSKHLEPTFPGFGKVVAALVAVGLESIALFLGLHAMKALRRKDSAAGLLLSATIVSGLVSYMNFENFASANGDFTHASWAFGLFSFVGPFIWRTKIRSDHRNELAANDEIDRRGIKLPRTMWSMHPIKSYKVYRLAAWTGQRDVEIAVKDWEQANTDAYASSSKPKDLDVLHALIENLKLDIHTNDTPQIDQPQRRELTPAHATEIERLKRHPKWNDGVAIYSASVDSGNPLKVSDLATEMGMTNRALAGKIREYVITQGRQSSVSDDGSDLAAETA